MFLGTNLKEVTLIKYGPIKSVIISPWTPKDHPVVLVEVKSYDLLVLDKNIMREYNKLSEDIAKLYERLRTVSKEANLYLPPQGVLNALQEETRLKEEQYLEMNQYS